MPELELIAIAALCEAAMISETLGWVVKDDKQGFKFTKLGKEYITEDGDLNEAGKGVLNAYLAGQRVSKMFAK